MSPQIETLAHRSQFAFLLLVLAQAAHSVEEYLTRLYDLFAPARLVSSLVSSDAAVGFLVANAALVTFGVWCWAVPVRSGWPSARGVAWFWTLLELGNGVGHSALALSRAGYFPGPHRPITAGPLAGWPRCWSSSRGGRRADGRYGRFICADRSIRTRCDRAAGQSVRRRRPCDFFALALTKRWAPETRSRSASSSVLDNRTSTHG